MPAINLPTINIDESDFKSKETMKNILDTLMKYRKELNYLLMNLDVENMPTIGGLIGDINGNHSLLAQTVDGITMQVGNINGDISSLQIQANGIIASVSDNTGAIASLVLTAQGLQSQVTNNKGDISTLTQTANGLQAQVTNNAGNISTLTQTAQGLQSQVTSIDGAVGSHSSQISQLSGSISSKVSISDFNGGNIVSLIEQTPSSIKLSASKIDVTGITTIYSPNKLASTVMSGQGISINSKISSGSPTYTYNIEWDGFIAYELGRGIHTIFPDNVEFRGGVSGLQLKFA